MPRHAYPDLTPPPYDEGGGTNRGFIYVLIFVVVAAFGGAIWHLYDTGFGARPAPHIAAPDGPYRVAPSDAQNMAEPAEQNAMYDSLDGHDETAAATPRPAPEAPIDAPPSTTGAPQIAATPAFSAHGAFVAQVAALQSEAAANAAWTRLSSRAPQLFGAAQMDVERADLGQRGIYFRVRAGYFADRANAARFCDRIRQMGQDCIVVTR